MQAKSQKDALGNSLEGGMCRIVRSAVDAPGAFTAAARTDALPLPCVLLGVFWCLKSGRQAPKTRG
jgi:hypothetical protein